MLVQLSDPHLRAGPNDQGAAAALAAAVRDVSALHPKPDAVLLSGDVAEHGAAAEYERARELLAPLTMPVHVLPGNHDDADELRAAFGPVPYAVRCGSLRLVACDTTLPDDDAGALGPERRAWLEATLAEEPATPTLLAMHHPPLLTGMPAMDQVALAAEDRQALGELTGAHPQVRTVIAGHVHRAVVGRVGPCPVFACPSVHLALALDLRPAEEPRVAIVDEPPAFAIHVLVEGEVASHVQPIGDFGPARPWT
jgi:Icc protein